MQRDAANRCITRRSSRRPTRYAVCPRLSLVVRPLAWYTAMTYTEPCGHVRRNPALHETGRRLPKRRSLRRTPKPSGEPSTRWSGDSRLRRGQKAGGVRKLRWALTRRGKRGGIRVIYFLRPERGSDLDADPVSQERGRQHCGARSEAGPRGNRRCLSTSIAALA